MKKTIVFLLLVIFIGNFLFPFLASAGEYQGYGGTVKYEGLVPCGKSEQGPNETEGVTKPCQLCHLFVMLDGIIDFVLIGILPWIVVLMILIAGVMFYFAGGNPSLLLQTKKLITSVVIGLAIILCSYLIIGTVLSVLGVLHWTTLDTWFEGNGVFMIDCPIGEPGSNSTNNTNNTTLPSDLAEDECADEGYYWYGGECHGEEENWDDSVQDTISSSDKMCVPIEWAQECADGFKLDRGKCESGVNTITTESRLTGNGKGWYCEFKGEVNPNAPANSPNQCYPPIGTLYIDCDIDPNYVPPEQITEWYEKEILPSNTEEIDGTKKCEEGYQVADDGECVPAGYSKVEDSKKTSDGRGWYCKFKSTDEPWVSGYSAPAAGTIRVHCIPE